MFLLMDIIWRMSYFVILATAVGLSIFLFQRYATSEQLAFLLPKVSLTIREISLF